LWPTGNGVFDAASGGRNYGDTLLKLRGSDLAVVDAFTPANQAELNARDWDLGSGGPILLPERTGRRLLLIAGKRAPLHVLGRRQAKGRGCPDSVDWWGLVCRRRVLEWTRLLCRDQRFVAGFFDGRRHTDRTPCGQQPAEIRQSRSGVPSYRPMAHATPSCG
jgi:hypothetical protein